MKKLTFATALVPLAVLAHEGHGLPGAAHWHPTDALGFMLVLAIAAGIVWWSRRK
ncbi:MAG: hypothetical protein ACOZJX_16135 [Pseudomonadota bacterium]